MATARDTTAAQYGQNTCGGTEKIVDLPDCKGCARNWCEFRRSGYPFIDPLLLLEGCPIPGAQYNTHIEGIPAAATATSSRHGSTPGEATEAAPAPTSSFGRKARQFLDSGRIRQVPYPDDNGKQRPPKRGRLCGPLSERTGDPTEAGALLPRTPFRASFRQACLDGTLPILLAGVMTFEVSDVRTD
jgi:hypothetical protein